MSRHNLYVIVFLFGLTNAMIRPIRENILELGFFQSLLNGFGISFIVWFAIYCCFDLLFKCKNRTSNTSDWTAAFIALCSFFVPSAFMSWLMLACYASYCAFISLKKGNRSRNACLIMLAISMRVPISDVCLKLSANSLLQFDAMATLSLLQFLQADVIRQGNIIIGSEGHELLIMTGCASFTNISLALLLWFTIVRSNVRHWSHNLSFYIVPLTILVMGINISRLAMMASSKEDYFFYHDGLGADIINACILKTSLGIALLTIGFDKSRNKECRYAS